MSAVQVRDGAGVMVGGGLGELVGLVETSGERFTEDDV